MEAFQSYQRTAVVLDHFDYEINTVLEAYKRKDGEHKKCSRDASSWL